MKTQMKLFLIVWAIISLACESPYATHNNPITYGDGYRSVQFSTDKVAYAPGESVTFVLNKAIDEAIMVRYKHLNEVIKEEPLAALTWTWTPPMTDFQGYLVDLYVSRNKVDSVLASVAVDVSSEPAYFPRNGFLSTYGEMTETEMETVVKKLNRYHINYVQFQDWHYKHHKPLAGNVSSPLTMWTDIISRNCYMATVQGYIDVAHRYGMKTLFYNLAYGALNDAADDGVQDEWYIYTDRIHGNKDVHSLGSPFKSSIFLLNTGNVDWQNYIAGQNDDVYKVFNFDGYQIDQLGYRGTVYDYWGNEVDLSTTFKSFIEAMKTTQPDKRLVMNSVGQYAQKDAIALAPVDFLYTEVWNHSNETGYSIFSDCITQNNRWSGGKKTVLAAYLNYAHGVKGRGYFNTSGVLMASAAAFAWGGSILQIGEHMLCNEYFPNNNLTMRGDLKLAMTAYYDFLVGYENLLRDGGEFIGISALCADTSVNINIWPPVKNQVATVGKRIDNVDVVHFLNYTNATHLDWCDTNADQGEPDLFRNTPVDITVKAPPKNVWAASPDKADGVSETIDFTYNNGTIRIMLPILKYWTMVIIEY